MDEQRGLDSVVFVCVQVRRGPEQRYQQALLSQRTGRVGSLGGRPLDQINGSYISAADAHAQLEEYVRTPTRPIGYASPRPADSFVQRLSHKPRRRDIEHPRGLLRGRIMSIEHVGHVLPVRFVILPEG